MSCGLACNLSWRIFIFIQKKIVLFQFFGWNHFFFMYVFDNLNHAKTLFSVTICLNICPMMQVGYQSPLLLSYYHQFCLNIFIFLCVQCYLYWVHIYLYLLYLLVRLIPLLQCNGLFCLLLQSFFFKSLFCPKYKYCCLSFLFVLHGISFSIPSLSSTFGLIEINSLICTTYGYFNVLLFSLLNPRVHG